MVIHVTKNNFSSGVISNRVKGRSDTDQYKNAVDDMNNFLIKKTGGADFRTGLKFVVEALDHATKSRVIDFQVNKENSYAIEFSDEIARPLIDGSVLFETPVSITGATVANPCILSVSSTSLFAVGDYFDVSAVTGMEELNGRSYKITSLAGTLIQFSDIAGTLIDSSSYGAYTSGGTVEKHVIIDSPYPAADLFDIQYAQSADVLFLAHGSYERRKITRVTDTNWTVSIYKTLDGPYTRQNTDAAKELTVSATTGQVSLSSNVDLFASTDVGRAVSASTASVRGWGTITAFSDAQNVTLSISSDFGSTAASSDWRLGAFSATTGYPKAVELHEDRLWYGYTDTDQQGVWGSNSNDYLNFAPTEADTTVIDSNAVTIFLATGKFDAVTWLKSGNILYTGTVGGVVTITGDGAPLSPSNARAARPNGIGSGDVMPLLINDSLVYVSRNNREIREFIFSFNEQNFVANHLSIISEDIFRTSGAILQSAYQQHPDGQSYFIVEDGTLVGMLFDREQSTLGFHKHTAGGTFEDATLTSGFTVVGKTYRIKNNINGADFTDIGAADNTIGTEFVATGILPTWGDGELALITAGQFESIATVTSADLSQDLLYCSVKRTINGNTRRYIECSYPEYSPSHTRDYEGMDFIDSSLKYSGVATDTVGNLDHLEGETVTILTNRGLEQDVVVSGGSITISQTATSMLIGLKYEGFLKLLPFEMQLSTYGDTTSNRRRITRGYVNIESSISISHGEELDDLKEVTFHKNTDYMDLPPELFTGIKDVLTNTASTRDGNYYIVQTKPYPLSVNYVIVDMTVNNK